MLLLLLLFNFSFSQEVKNDSIKNDSITITEVISLQDTIPNDSIDNDSVNDKGIKYSIVSPDAIDTKIDYSGKDSMMFNLKEKKIYIYGQGKIVTKEMELEAEFIEINTSENYLYAEGRVDSTGKIIGKPVFKEGKETMNSKNIKYNFKTKKAIVKDLKTQYSEGYIHSEKSKMYPNKEIHISQGKYTTCDLDHPHYYIKLTKAKVIPGEKVVSGPMYFVIADIPLYIGLPFGYIPNQKKNTSGLIIPSYGEEERRGFYLRNLGYYWAASDHLDFEFSADIFTQGSWGLGLNTRFKKRYKYSGNLDIDYAVNRIGEKELPNSSLTETFNVRGSYQQDSKANPNSNFSVTLNFGSSKHDQLNAVNINQYTNNTKSSSITYRRSKPGSLFNFSVSLRGEQNTRSKMVNLTLPNFTLNMKRLTPFKKKSGSGKTKWYEKITIGFNTSLSNRISIRDSLVFTSEIFDKMQNGLKYDIPIGTSFKIFKHINVSPSFNYHGRMYYLHYLNKHVVNLPNNEGVIEATAVDDTISRFQHPYDFSASLPLSTKIFGIFNFGETKLRHVLSPSVSLNYRPDFAKPFWNFYDTYVIDSTEYQYSHSELGIFSGPPKGKSGSVSFTLGNNLEMKMRNKKDTAEDYRKIKILENLSINTSYNFAAEKFKWSLITIRGNTKLFKKLSLNFGASFDPYRIDSTGIRIDSFEWGKNGRIARFTNGNIRLGGSLNSSDSKDKKDETDQNFYYYPYSDIPYDPFELPWNLTVNYNFNFSKKFEKTTQKFENNITQTLSLSGSLTITKNWAVRIRADYDFKAKKLAHTSINIHRDLHCWEMSLNVIPLGRMKSYNFQINIKSSLLKGLKYKKQKHWQDNYF